MAKPTGAPTAPKHLRTHTRRWFDQVISDYELDGHHVKLLTLACEAWDQAQTAREVLDCDGQTFLDRFAQPKERPEVGILQNARISFARLLRELALDGVDGPEAPRMARTPDYGSRR
ncbi:P27 family phage terminase small subunit [Bradyrhizobium sp. 61]|uniref:P27 family phage terminase small subunit n=1 Tax=unclassified Bradyrhizobium TaxID=2631580 RepID=UPI001FFB06EB|nr:P27 family phage terminase small subunit [Bradyrhizobium sp. 61]MCK1279467.1 hypothetical protein [Bradyrhizobium sp. 61]